MTSGQLLFEIDQMIDNFKDTQPVQVKLTYHDLPYTSIKVAVEKYRGRLHEPEALTPYYWAMVRIGKLTFELIGAPIVEQKPRTLVPMPD